MGNLIDNVKRQPGRPSSFDGNDMTEEEMEVALAWCYGKVSSIQIEKGLGHIRGNKFYAFIARALRDYIITRGIDYEK